MRDDSSDGWIALVILLSIILFLTTGGDIPPDELYRR